MEKSTQTVDKMGFRRMSETHFKQASPAPHFFPILGNAFSADHASLSYRQNPVQSSLFGSQALCYEKKLNNLSPYQYRTQVA